MTLSWESSCRSGQEPVPPQATFYRMPCTQLSEPCSTHGRPCCSLGECHAQPKIQSHRYCHFQHLACSSCAWRTAACTGCCRVSDGLACQVGMVFQHSALFDSLTVGDNVGFLLREHSSLAPERIRVRPALVYNAHAWLGTPRRSRCLNAWDALVCQHQLLGAPGAHQGPRTSCKRLQPSGQAAAPAASGALISSLGAADCP